MKFNIFNYNQKKACELKLDLKDLLILDWFQSFQPKMHKTIRDNKQYYWIQYNKLITDIPIIEITTPKGLFKRLQAMCDIGLLEYLPIRTGNGCFSYYLITDKILLLLSDSHSSESSSGSSESSYAIYNSSIINNPIINNPTINPQKIYKKEISLSKKEDLEQIKENHFYEVYKTFCEKEDLQERTIKSKEYQDTFKKYQNALKKYSHEEILKGIQDYIIFLQCQRKTGFNRDKQGIIPFFNQEKFLGEKGLSWQELIDKMSTGLKPQEQRIEYDKKIDIVYILDQACQVYSSIKPKQIKPEDKEILDKQLSAIKEKTLTFTLKQALQLDGENKKKTDNMLWSAWYLFCEKNDPAKFTQRDKFYEKINNPIYQEQSFMCFVNTLANIDLKQRKEGIGKEEFFIDELRRWEEIAKKQLKLLIEKGKIPNLNVKTLNI